MPDLELIVEARGGWSTCSHNFRWLIVLICGLVLVPAVFSKSWRVTDFNDTISVESDGSAVVQERITLSFEGEWHGIHRFIPVEYPGPRGTNFTLFLSITGVTDGNGGKL